MKREERFAFWLEDEKIRERERMKDVRKYENIRFLCF